MRSKGIKGNITGICPKDTIISLFINGVEWEYIVPTIQYTHVKPNYGTPIWVKLLENKSPLITKRRIHSRKSKKKIRTKTRKGMTSIIQKLIDELLDEL